MPRSTRNGAPMRSTMSSGVTKRRLSQLVPSSAIRSPRAADRVAGDKDPLRAGAMCRAETSELGDEWIHATFLHRPSATLKGSPYILKAGSANDGSPESMIVTIGWGKNVFCSAHACEDSY